MTTLKYNMIQMRWIHKYARRLEVSDEQAAMYWIQKGLAKHFGEIYSKYLKKPIDK